MLDVSAHFKTFPTLETERFILRELTDDDTTAIFEIMSDPEVSRYLGRPPMATMEEAKRRVDIFKNEFTKQDGYAWAITRREDGYMIGFILFWGIDPAHYRAEAAYSLRSQFWGQGITPEAMTAGIDFMFKTVGLHSLKAQTDPDNKASRRVLEKLGFEQEGYFREDYYIEHEGRFSSTAHFGLVVSDWNGRKG